MVWPMGVRVRVCLCVVAMAMWVGAPVGEHIPLSYNMVVPSVVDIVGCSVFSVCLSGGQVGSSCSEDGMRGGVRKTVGIDIFYPAKLNERINIGEGLL